MLILKQGAQPLVARLAFVVCLKRFRNQTKCGKNPAVEQIGNGPESNLIPSR
jgi:hypothetical protein